MGIYQSPRFGIIIIEKFSVERPEERIVFHNFIVENQSITKGYSFFGKYPYLYKANRDMPLSMRSKEVKQTEGEEDADDLRLAFELRYFRKLYANIQPINTGKMINYTFIDTTFDELDKIVILDEGL